MYVPEAFRIQDRALLHAAIRRHAFATLVSADEGTPFATHLPLRLEADAGPHGVLVGHMARANPHWRSLDGRREALAVFLGPHAYISPAWYESASTVPTWNYVAVHVYGAPRLIEDADRVQRELEQLVAEHEAQVGRPWSERLPADLQRRLAQAIVAFELPIDRIEGKFKLSQNRSPGDQTRLQGVLDRADGEAARSLGAYMREVARERAG